MTLFAPIHPKYLKNTVGFALGDRARQCVPSWKDE